MMIATALLRPRRGRRRDVCRPVAELPGSATRGHADTGRRGRRTGRPGVADRRRRAVRRRPERHDHPGQRRGAGGRARHRRPHRRRRRAGPARAGVPSGRHEGLRQLHRQQRRHQRRRVGGRRRRRLRSGEPAHGAGRRAALRQPQRRRPGVRSRRDAVHRPRRRRRRRRPGAAGARTSPSCSARCCASTRPPRRATSATRSPPTTRSSARKAPAARSGRSGCATRGATASTPRPATCGSPTSARAASRRSTSPRRPTASTPPAAPTSGGAPSRAANRSTTTSTAEGHSAPIFEYDHSDGRCSISGGVRARGEGAGPLAGWYVYSDYCTGEVMALAVSGEGTGITVDPEAAVLANPGESVSAVASGPDGAVYVLTFGDAVYRLDPACLTHPAQLTRWNATRPRRDVGGDEADADLVAGRHPCRMDAGEDRRFGDLHHRPVAVLVDDDAVEQLALATGEQHRLGEVVDGVVDTVAAFVRLAPSPAAARRTPLRRGRARGRRWRPPAPPRRRSGRRVVAAARWRGRTWRPSPRATASRPRCTARSSPRRRPAARRAGRRRCVGRRAGSERWKRAERHVGGPVEPERLGGVAQPADRPLGDVRHHPEQPGLRRVEGVGDRQIGGQRHPGVAILALQPSVEAQLPAVVGELEHLLGELDSRRLRDDPRRRRSAATSSANVGGQGRQRRRPRTPASACCG